MRIILFLLLVTIAGGVPAQEPEYTVGSYFEPGVQFGNGRIYAGRNPAQPSDLVEFLREARIQQAIELTKEQEAAFRSLYSQIHRRGAVLAGDQVDVAKSREYSLFRKTATVKYLDEVLTPEQRKRLVQLAHRTEIHEIGLAASIAQGRWRTRLE